MPSTPQGAERIPLRDRVDLLRRLVAGATRGQRTRLCLLVVLQLNGIAAGLGSFLVLIDHAQFELGGTTPRFVSWLPLAPSATSDFLVSGAVALGLGIFSAWCLYEARRRVLDLARSFHRLCIERALDSMQGRSECQPDPTEFLAEHHDHRHVAPLYARYVATAYRILLESLHPAAVVSLGGVILLVLDPWLTLLMTPLAFAAWPILRRLARRAAAAHGRALAGSADLNPRLARLSEELARDGIGTDHLLDPARLDQMLDEQYEPLLLLQRAASASQVVVTVGLVCLFSAVGLGFGSAGGSWAALITYLIVLRFVAGGLRTLSVSAVSLARYLPSIRIYWGFVGPGAADRAPTTSPAHGPN